MSIGVPVRLANGIGNWPDAQKWMDNYDYLTSLIYGNFSLNGGMELWNTATTFSNPAHGATVADSWVVLKTGTLGATVDVSREATIINSGVYSMKLDITGAGSANSIWDVHQSLATPARFASETVLLGVRVRASSANKVRCKVFDGTTTTYSTYHTGGSTFELLTAQLAVASVPSELTISIEVNPSDFTGAVYVDSAFLYVVPSQLSTTVKSALAFSALNAGFLPLSGGVMTGAILASDGTVSLPGLAFASDADCGMYRIGANNIAFATGGTKALEITSTQRVGVVDGSAASPAVIFSSDTDSGMWKAGADVVGISAGGTNRVTFSASGVITNSVPFLAGANGLVGSPAFSWNDDTDCGMYRIGTNNIGLAVNGAVAINIGTSGVTIKGTNTNDDASAGWVGEHIESVVGDTAFPTSSTNFADLTSIALTAGDWDIDVSVYHESNGATWSSCSAGIGTVSGNDSTNMLIPTSYTAPAWANSSATPLAMMSALPGYRMKLSGNATIYLKWRNVFSAGTPRGRGRISARRRR